MAWPDSPPQEQLDAYNAGLSGSTELVPLRDGSYGDVPTEYVNVDPFGSSAIKSGWYYPDELQAWLDAEAAPEPDPVVAQVQAYLGQHAAGVSVDTIAARLLVQRQAVLAYTRGVGFVDGKPNDDLAAVILSATARDVANPGYFTSTTNGPFQRAHAPNSGGWTLQELASLNRYRKRAD